MSEMAKKVANNMLEFLIDPTVFPLTRRLYFRPEERLQNGFFEEAKADSFKAYGTQKHNSDFYPTRNRQTSKEPMANILRRMASRISRELSRCQVN